METFSYKFIIMLAMFSAVINSFSHAVKLDNFWILYLIAAFVWCFWSFEIWNKLKEFDE